MRFVALALAAFAGIGPFGAPGLAHAQGTGTILVFLTKVGDEDVSTLGEVSIGLDACEQDLELAFELDQVPASKTHIDVYRGSNCTSVDRDDMNTGDCRFVTNVPIEDRTLDLQVPIRARQLAAASGLADCTRGTSTPKLWFLAVNDSRSNEEVGTDYGEFPSGSVTEFEIDNDPPDPPDNVTGGSGENQIPIEWDSDETDLEEFIVFIDSGAGPGDGSADAGAEAGECGASLLRPGASADSVPSSVRQKTLRERSATGIDLSSDDVDGDMAAIAVVAIDKAGNASELSELACVQVVPTVGFWDRYEAQGGDADTGCRAAGRPRSTPTGAFFVALALVALVRRSRRHA